MWKNPFIVGNRRCIAAFPKQTLIHERNILACWMTASHDIADLGA
jgi:hypothetical protein